MKLLHELIAFIREDTASAITLVRWVVIGIGLIAVIWAIGLAKHLVTG